MGTTRRDADRQASTREAGERPAGSGSAGARAAGARAAGGRAAGARAARPAGPGRARTGGRPAPRRRPSRATIVRRRIVALLVLLAVLALVVWGVVAGIRALRGVASADAVEPAPETTTGPVDPTACAPRDLQVDLTPSVGGPGEPVAFAVALVNDGEVPCLVDAGTAALVFTVTSGSDRVWSSGDCAAEPAERRLLLDAGDRAETTLAWSGGRSAPGCPDGQGSSGPGTYRVEAELGGALLEGATATFARG